jgi:putative tryptophan/tyrosine transport system substrate-binding protein
MTSWRCPQFISIELSRRPGGLMSYGANVSGAFRAVRTDVGRTLKGESVPDLPLQQVTQFESFINLKTAKKLDLTAQMELLARAEQVIE